MVRYKCDAHSTDLDQGTPTEELQRSGVELSYPKGLKDEEGQRHNYGKGEEDENRPEHWLSPSYPAYLLDEV